MELRHLRHFIAVARIAELHEASARLRVASRVHAEFQRLHLPLGHAHRRYRRERMECYHPSLGHLYCGLMASSGGTLVK